MATEKTIWVKGATDQVAAEDIINAFGQENVGSQDITLDFSECRGIDIGAGSRLANAMRRHAQKGLIIAIVPGVSSKKDFAGEWFLVFTRSGVGQAIAQYAKTICSSGKDVTDVVKQYYESQSDLQVSNNLVTLRNIHHGKSINLDNYDSFLKTFTGWLDGVNKTVQQFVIEVDKNLSPVGELCFEASQNTFDHASKTPLPAGIEIASEFSIRYYKSIATPKFGPLTGYLKRLRRHRDTFGEDPSFIEVVVRDDGVGIAPRQSQDAGICSGAISAEEKAVSLSLAAGGTIKLRTADAVVRGDPGYGYTKIQDGIEKLSAYASLRTGRLLAHFDGLVKIRREFVFSSGRHGQSFAYLPGTILQVVIPLQPIKASGRREDTMQGALDF